MSETNKPIPPFPSKIVKLVLTPAQFDACAQIKNGVQSVDGIAKALGISYDAAWGRLSSIRREYQITHDELVAMLRYVIPSNKKNIRRRHPCVYITKSGRYAARIYRDGRSQYIGSYLTAELIGNILGRMPPKRTPSWLPKNSSEGALFHLLHASRNL